MAEPNQQDQTGGGNNPNPKPVPKPVPPKPPGPSRLAGVASKAKSFARVAKDVVWCAAIGLGLVGLALMAWGHVPLPWKKLPRPVTITIDRHGNGEVIRVQRETFQVNDPYNLTDEDRQGLEQKLDYIQPKTKPVPVPQTKNGPVAEPPQKPTTVIQQRPSVEEGPPPMPAKAAVVPPAKTVTPPEPPTMPKQPKATPKKTTEPNPCPPGYYRAAEVGQRGTANVAQGRDIRYPNGGIR